MRPLPKHAKPAPKHRGAPKHAHIAEAPRKAARNVVILSSVAVAVTGVSVAAGLAGQDAGSAVATDATRPDPDALVVAGSIAAATPGSDESTASSSNASADPVEVVDDADTPGSAASAPRREPVVSRSDRRGEADPRKLAALAESKAAAFTDERTLSQSDPKDIARALLGEFGFSSDQFGCLDSLWTRESNWRVNADNPSSSAYGIPQALPGSKMNSAGADWATNPATQIKWGLGYIRDRYGSPCGAWGHSQSNGWY